MIWELFFPIFFTKNFLFFGHVYQKCTFLFHKFTFRSHKFSGIHIRLMLRMECPINLHGLNRVSLKKITWTMLFCAKMISWEYMTRKIKNKKYCVCEREMRIPPYKHKFQIKMFYVDLLYIFIMRLIKIYYYLYKKKIIYY